MGRKRQYSQKDKPHRKKYGQGNKITYFSHPRLIDQVIEYLFDKQEPVTKDRIIKDLELSNYSKAIIKDVLKGLEKSGEVQVSAKRYSIGSKGKLLKATLELTHSGFGFAIMDDSKTFDKDVFIARTNINGASHGDRVFVRILGSSRGRYEGRVVKVIERSITKLCGIFTTGGKTGYVTPDNERLPFTVFIRRKNSLGARDNTAVLVEITDFGSERRGPEGKIIEVLGDPNRVAVQMRMAIEQLELARSFPENVLSEAASLEAATESGEERQDLRHILHVTIDGANAKDFDDAIAVNITDFGFELYVSIADVSHYVRPNSAIDREAYNRGTSFYLPDRVLPMLPERLSNDLCSLVPNQDRPAFTAIVSFNENGMRLGQKFSKSIIRSRQRFTYHTVNQILYEKQKDPGLVKQHETLLPMLMEAKQLARLLRSQRVSRGSIGFNIPEPDIKLADEKIISIKHAQRNQAHQLIEEFMLAANEAVAYVLDKAKQPVLFRTHDLPDPEKVEAFIESAASMGLQLPKIKTSPEWFAEVLDKVKDSPSEYVVNNLLLRTMQQARYTPENIGHFGLAAQYYLHFTSPIRRYPDLIAHRVLHNFLTSEKIQSGFVPDKISLAEAGEHLSRQERKSVDLERNVHSRLSSLYMSERIGEEFDGVISGVTTYGLYVELIDHFISGAVPMQEMHDDYYIYDNQGHRLIGEGTGKIYQLGNLVRVKLQQVQILSKRIIFSIIPND